MDRTFGLVVRLVEGKTIKEVVTIVVDEHGNASLKVNNVSATKNLFNLKEITVFILVVLQFSPVNNGRLRSK